MNKSPKENGPDPYVQTHRKSPGKFLNFYIFLKVKRIIISGGREMDSYVLMWNMLVEQVSMMETWKNS